MTNRISQYFPPKTTGGLPESEFWRAVAKSDSLEPLHERRVDCPEEPLPVFDPEMQLAKENWCILGVVIGLVIGAVLRWVVG